MALSRTLAVLLLPLLAAIGSGTRACSIDAAYPAPQVQRLLTAPPQHQLASMQQRLSELSGCTIRIVDYPLARLWHTYELGDLPLVIGAIHSPDRDALGQFYPMLQVQVVLITRAGSTTTTGSLLASPPDRLGILRGSRSTPAGESLRAAMEQKGRLDYSVESSQLLHKLQLNRTQAVLSYSILYAIYQSEQLTAGLIARAAPELGTTEAGIYLNPRKLDERDSLRLRDAILQLQREYYLARLLRGKLDQALIVPLPASKPTRQQPK